MSDKIELAKGITKFVVSTSVGTVVKRVIKQNVTTTNQIEEIQLVIGAYVIGGMIGDRALDWADSRLDSAIAKVQKFKSRNEEPTTEEIPAE